jgi:tetratricopeptide (TPR) repeat protein
VKGSIIVANTRNQKATKRQLVADALAAALEGRWEDAIELNDKIIERFPRDADARNRKGRALIELRQLNAARDAYSESLKADPANMIARRNLQRLEMLYTRSEGLPEGETTAKSSLPRSNVFIEEIGKTWVDELANPAELGQLAEVSPGEQLNLQVVDSKVTVVSDDEVVLGEVDSRIGQRIAELMKSGNRYEVYALGVSSQSLRVIIREVYKDPSVGTRISFPRQNRATQDLMRERELLFQRDEGDFVFSDDDEEIVDDDSADADIDPDEPDADATAYVDGVITDDEDEEKPAE